ncbi:MAG: hypothetical protein KF914_18250 [Rhizobiaceae bacterium]|nr:hypothetical protein [Rhizobiaceae bacterium]
MTVGPGCDAVLSAIYLLAFDSYDEGTPCTNDIGVYAFACLAALSFAAITAVDLIIFLLKRYGLSTSVSRVGFVSEDGVGRTLWKALLAVVLGAIAAWIVAFLAAIVEFLKIAPQTAVATGVLWQVAYAQLLTRLGSEATPGKTSSAPVPPRDIQKPAVEVEE